MPFVEATLGVDESTDEIVLEGNCDVWISNLSSGTVKLQLRFPRSSTWRDAAEYSADAYKTIYVGESGIRFRLLGVSNNADVYARLARAHNGY